MYKMDSYTFYMVYFVKIECTYEGNINPLNASVALIYKPGIYMGTTLAFNGLIES